MLELAKWNDVMDNAFEETAPHKICAYIFDLSNAFNRFYHGTSSSPTRIILIRPLTALRLVMTVWLQMQSSPKQS